MTGEAIARTTEQCELGEALVGTIVVRSCFGSTSSLGTSTATRSPMMAR